ncbi:MAG: hypothetical protein IJ315_02330 [Firmicutes bacterium]|nr:hypothetical protein [Bacillota bacterium]
MDKFEYTYSAKQQEEIKRIREKYVPREPDKMEQLRRLDASVTRKSTMISLVVGIIGVLTLGVGMSCCMVWNVFAPGIIIGLVGIVGVALAYPLYVRVTRKEREKIAPQILHLTEELLK